MHVPLSPAIFGHHYFPIHLPCVPRPHRSPARLSPRCRGPALPLPPLAQLGSTGTPNFSHTSGERQGGPRVLRERGPGTTLPPEMGKETSDELHQAGRLPGAMAFFCALTTFFLPKFWESSDTRVAFPDPQIPSRAGAGLAAPGGSLASPRTLPVSPANALLPSHKTRKPPSSSTSDICSRSKETTKNNYKSVSKEEKEGDSDSRSAGDL